jgi:hypothetical protein
MRSGMTTSDWISAATNVVQATAIVVGAAWAYLQFARGRTFARRAELSVEGDLLRAFDKVAIRARVILCNTGSSRITLRTKAVLVYAVAASDWTGQESPAWTKIRVEPVFAEHATIEARERLSDVALVPIPHADVLAYRLELRIYDRRRWRRGATCWSSETVVPVTLRVTDEPSTRELSDEQQ